MADLLVARAEDDHVALLFEDRSYTWREVLAASAARASVLLGMFGARPDAGDASRPPHVGVLLGNVPEYLFWLGAAALSGCVVVGINATRRGEALADDVRRTDCQLVLTDAEGAALLEGLDLGASATVPVVRIDDPGYDDRLAGQVGADPRAIVAAARPQASDLYLLLFTSGTTGTPKAVRCTQGRLAAIALGSSVTYGFTRDDVAYCTMPLFHGNALMALWGPCVVAGAAVALARRFSASGFVPDVRRYGATTFTYVGKALAYVLATPPRPDDAELPLRRGFGTEASVADQSAFERRFGCVLTEGYGSSEGGANITRGPDTPPGSLGRPRDDLAIVDPDSLAECPPAVFDSTGRLVNAEQAVGEIVNRSGPGRFEGYYRDAEATAARVRNGWYWTGDLAYRDEAGFLYFAGRRGDWLRVDSENLSAGPIERVLVRWEAAAIAAVYAVPDPRTGDQVMAAVELLPGAAFDPGAFGTFLAGQPDLGTKWAPAFVRVSTGLPQTASGRATKEPLRRQGWWSGDDPIYRRVPGTWDYMPLTEGDRAELHAELARHGRGHLVTG